jgi:hypothetical protein
LIGCEVASPFFVKAIELLVHGIDFTECLPRTRELDFRRLGKRAPVRAPRAALARAGRA